MILKAPVFAFVFLTSLLESDQKKEGQASSVSRSSQILASDHSPEITCTSRPIWDQGLTHCSSSEHPLGVSTMSPRGLPCQGCSQLTPSGNTVISAAAVCTVQRSSPLPLQLLLWPEILKILYTLVKKHDAEQTVEHPTFYEKRRKLKWIF